MKTKIYGTYAPDTDITFILKDTFNEEEMCVSTEVVGFVYGNEVDNEALLIREAGKLKAEYQTLFEPQIGENCFAKATSEKIIIGMNTFDEVEYDCWELIKKYAALFDVQLECEDDEEPDFWMAKQVQEAVLNLFTGAGFVFVRKDE